jgi:hypothetical protein
VLRKSVLLKGTASEGTEKVCLAYGTASAVP